MKIIPNITVQHGKKRFPPGAEIDLPDPAAKDLITRGFAKASTNAAKKTAAPPKSPAPPGSPSSNPKPGGQPPSDPPADDPPADDPPADDPRLDPADGQ